MDDFRVSVIIPVYRAEEYVAEAAESALQQPQTGEVILVEDGLPDGSLAVCQKLARKHSAVRLLRHSGGGNHGAAASRDLGIRSGTFPLVAFLDADDLYLPHRFSKTAEVFASGSQVDGVYEAIGTTFADDKARERWSRLPFREITTVTKSIAPESLFIELMKGGSGYFSFDGFTGRQNVFSEAGYFNERLPIAEDTDLMYKLSAKAKLYPGSLESPIALRRVHSANRITYHLENKREAYESLARVWQSLLMWGEQNLTAEQRKVLMHRYISHLRKIDYFEDFRWRDYLTSRMRICHLAIHAPELLTDTFFWRRIIPSRGLFRVAKHD